MKKQFLGDSLDCFKWDYLDCLIVALEFQDLLIDWMMTPDDKSGHGATSANLYGGGRQAIVSLCAQLKHTKNIKLVKSMPQMTGSKYEVHFVEPIEAGKYKEVKLRAKQALFYDPDNGFEPKNTTLQHVKFTDIERVIREAEADTLVVVFHHFRRKKFADDFADIQRSLISGYSTGLQWNNKLMFVCISKSASLIERVAQFNLEYKSSKMTVYN